MGNIGCNEGDIGWIQLNSHKSEATLAFYSDMLGWETKGEPMPGYHVFGKGDEMMGGITVPMAEGGGPGWVPYVTVMDLDAVLLKVKFKGGKLITGPDALPDGGRMALIEDPSGNTTGLAQYARGATGK